MNLNSETEEYRRQVKQSLFVDTPLNNGLLQTDDYSFLEKLRQKELAINKQVTSVKTLLTKFDDPLKTKYSYVQEKENSQKFIGKKPKVDSVYQSPTKNADKSSQAMRISLNRMQKISNGPDTLFHSSKEGYIVSSSKVYNLPPVKQGEELPAKLALHDLAISQDNFHAKDTYEELVRLRQRREEQARERLKRQQELIESYERQHLEEELRQREYRFLKIAKDHFYRNIHRRFFMQMLQYFATSKKFGSLIQVRARTYFSMKYFQLFKHRIFLNKMIRSQGILAFYKILFYRFRYRILTYSRRNFLLRMKSNYHAKYFYQQYQLKKAWKKLKSPLHRQKFSDLLLRMQDYYHKSLLSRYFRWFLNQIRNYLNWRQQTHRMLLQYYNRNSRVKRHQQDFFESLKDLTRQRRDCQKARVYCLRRLVSESFPVFQYLRQIVSLSQVLEKGKDFSKRKYLSETCNTLLKNAIQRKMIREKLSVFTACGDNTGRKAKKRIWYCASDNEDQMHLRYYLGIWFNSFNQEVTSSRIKRQKLIKIYERLLVSTSIKNYPRKRKGLSKEFLESPSYLQNFPQLARIIRSHHLLSKRMVLLKVWKRFLNHVSAFSTRRYYQDQLQYTIAKLNVKKIKKFFWILRHRILRLRRLKYKVKSRLQRKIRHYWISWKKQLLSHTQRQLKEINSFEAWRLRSLEIFWAQWEEYILRKRNYPATSTSPLSSKRLLITRKENTNYVQSKEFFYSSRSLVHLKCQAAMNRLRNLCIFKRQRLQLIRKMRFEVYEKLLRNTLKEWHQYITNVRKKQYNTYVVKGKAAFRHRKLLKFFSTWRFIATRRVKEREGDTVMKAYERMKKIKFPVLVTYRNKHSSKSTSKLVSLLLPTKKKKIALIAQVVILKRYLNRWYRRRNDSKANLKVKLGENYASKRRHSSTVRVPPSDPVQIYHFNLRKRYFRFLYERKEASIFTHDIISHHYHQHQRPLLLQKYLNKFYSFIKERRKASIDLANTFYRQYRLVHSIMIFRNFIRQINAQQSRSREAVSELQRKYHLPKIFEIWKELIFKKKSFKSVMKRKVSTFQKKKQFRVILNKFIQYYLRPRLLNESGQAHYCIHQLTQYWKHWSLQRQNKRWRKRQEEKVLQKFFNSKQNKVLKKSFRFFIKNVEKRAKLRKKQLLLRQKESRRLLFKYFQHILRLVLQNSSLIPSIPRAPSIGQNILGESMSRSFDTCAEKLSFGTSFEETYLLPNFMPQRRSNDEKKRLPEVSSFRKKLLKSVSNSHLDNTAKHVKTELSQEMIHSMNLRKDQAIEETPLLTEDVLRPDILLQVPYVKQQEDTIFTPTNNSQNQDFYKKIAEQTPLNGEELVSPTRLEKEQQLSKISFSTLRSNGRNTPLSHDIIPSTTSPKASFNLSSSIKRLSSQTFPNLSKIKTNENGLAVEPLSNPILPSHTQENKIHSTETGISILPLQQQQSKGSDLVNSFALKSNLDITKQEKNEFVALNFAIRYHTIKKTKHGLSVLCNFVRHQRIKRMKLYYYLRYRYFKNWYQSIHLVSNSSHRRFILATKHHGRHLIKRGYVIWKEFTSKRKLFSFIPSVDTLVISNQKRAGKPIPQTLDIMKEFGSKENPSDETIRASSRNIRRHQLNRCRFRYYLLRRWKTFLDGVFHYQQQLKSKSLKHFHMHLLRSAMRKWVERLNAENKVSLNHSLQHYHVTLLVKYFRSLREYRENRGLLKKEQDMFKWKTIQTALWIWRKKIFGGNANKLEIFRFTNSSTLPSDISMVLSAASKLALKSEKYKTLSALYSENRFFLYDFFISQRRLYQLFHSFVNLGGKRDLIPSDHCKTRHNYIMLLATKSQTHRLLRETLHALKKRVVIWQHFRANEARVLSKYHLQQLRRTFETWRIYSDKEYHFGKVMIRSKNFAFRYPLRKSFSSWRFCTQLSKAGRQIQRRKYEEQYFKFWFNKWNRRKRMRKFLPLLVQMIRKEFATYYFSYWKYSTILERKLNQYTARISNRLVLQAWAKFYQFHRTLKHQRHSVLVAVKQYRKMVGRTYIEGLFANVSRKYSQRDMIQKSQLHYNYYHKGIVLRNLHYLKRNRIATTYYRYKSFQMLLNCLRQNYKYYHFYQKLYLRRRVFSHLLKQVLRKWKNRLQCHFELKAKFHRSNRQRFFRILQTKYWIIQESKSDSKINDKGNIEFTNDDSDANFVHFKDSEMMNKEKEKFRKEKFLQKLSFHNQSNATHAKGKTVGSARYLDFAEPKQSLSLATAEVTRSQGNRNSKIKFYQEQELKFQGFYDLFANKQRLYFVFQRFVLHRQQRRKSRQFADYYARNYYILKRQLHRFFHLLLKHRNKQVRKRRNFQFFQKLSDQNLLRRSLQKFDYYRIMKWKLQQENRLCEMMERQKTIKRAYVHWKKFCPLLNLQNVNYEQNLVPLDERLLEREYPLQSLPLFSNEDNVNSEEGSSLSFYPQTNQFHSF